MVAATDHLRPSLLPRFLSKQDPALYRVFFQGLNAAEVGICKPHVPSFGDNRVIEKISFYGSVEESQREKRRGRVKMRAFVCRWWER